MEVYYSFPRSIRRLIEDVGSIPDRRDLVKSKAKVGGLLGFVRFSLIASLQAEQVDKANQILAKWFFCALSKVCHYDWRTPWDPLADGGWA